MNPNVKGRKQRSRVQGGWNQPPTSLRTEYPLKSKQSRNYADQKDIAQSLQPQIATRTQCSRQFPAPGKAYGIQTGQSCSVDSTKLSPNFPSQSQGAMFQTPVLQAQPTTLTEGTSISQATRIGPSALNKEKRYDETPFSRGNHPGCVDAYAIEKNSLQIEGSKIKQNLLVDMPQFTFQQLLKQASVNPSSWKPVMPKNFSWVIDNKLCAMGFPGEPGNMQYLLDNNVTYLISLTAERQPDVQLFPQLTLFPVKVVDFNPPTLEQIDQCLDIIERANNEGKAAGIHCAHGKGRTGTVIACFFIKHYGMTSTKAIQQIRIFRPQSIETKEQEQTIMEFEETFLKRRDARENIEEKQGDLERSEPNSVIAKALVISSKTSNDDQLRTEISTDNCGEENATDENNSVCERN